MIRHTAVTVRSRIGEGLVSLTSLTVLVSTMMSLPPEWREGMLVGTARYVVEES